ncbi:MAG: DUF952 domain-containing protein [Cytophagales bacterium]|jgi:uncharacterized protein (DUF952 family)|nr:DUF952 domain-containing protein [Cytophagales bacterium]MCA6371917.1 DUF952 domain-containing protein [Cytophagales bacterium]MCA6376625.1 DUF952 domain-containing protein [Cytophagales bacterium]MCA6383665.1 DUF952 domain-containing protein [Cytophagales bacterium]
MNTKSNTIYHITTLAAWVAQQASDEYTTESLNQEGFIHCSTKEQVKATLERYYSYTKDLLLLHINSSGLLAELKFELATNGELFPHVFGKLNKSAIVEIEKLT